MTFNFETITAMNDKTSSTLESFLRDLGLNELQQVAAVIDGLIEEKELNMEITEEKVRSCQVLMDSLGMTMEEIVSIYNSELSTKFKRPVKYIFPDQHGNPQRWAGVGKMPNNLQILLDSGRDLEEFRAYPKTKDE
jgi:DNA-binding protein H-NS